MSAIPPAGAQERSDNLRNTFGEIGMLDMPSGHTAPDGQLSFTVSDIGKTQRYSLGFQILPWLETSFRYSAIPDLFGIPNYYDRSFGMKLRLLKESADLPDVSLGIRDVLGTGIYNSEYLAASKHFGNLDVTAGLGWGRLADNGTLPNPFGLILPSFKKSRVLSGTGTFNFSQFFHGPKVGVFGGVVWQTPIDDLQLLAEYSSDQYAKEGAFPGGLKTRTPINVGLSYKPLDSLSLSAGWFYGTTYGFTINLSGDTTKSAESAMRIGPQVPPPAVRSSTEQQQSLSLMLDRNADIAAARAGGPWVPVPTETERAKQDLKQALLSESRSVRDIDIQGTTLVVDAHSLGNARAQCTQYAVVASAFGTRVTSIAMTDLQNVDGLVTFCPVATHANYAQGDMQSGPASNGTVVKITDQAALERTLRADMDKQSIYLDALSLGTSELWLYYDNGHYESESAAAGRIARLLMADAPPSVEIFHLIATISGMPAQEITIVRSALERAALSHGVASGLGDAITLSAPPLDNPILDHAALSFYPYIYWSLDPKLTEHVFDPDKPLQFMVYADASAGVALTPGLMVRIAVTANIWNDYTFTRDPGSLLPHVRTDLLKYIKQGQYGISSLNVTYRTRLARDVFAEAEAGYLEDMFMGGGGQVLWRPENSRIAIGVDIYQVWKRDFNRLFGTQSYHILTGHTSIYYRSPWYGLNFNVHVGRYLAGDYGATFEVTRRFSSGVEIGAFATLTNVPFSRFGEGSFDKGITIHIPFEWGLPFYSQSAYDLHLSSLTRDGGQRLSGDDSLYEETGRTSYGEIAEHFDDLVEP